MRQGLDIADVEERTKIRAKYLRALENEEWGTLPGHTFVKTFLRTYAEQVGVDPHLLVEEYRLSHEGEEPEVQPLARPPRAPRREPRRDRRRASGPPGRWALLALGAAGLIAFLLVLGLFGDDEPAEERAATATARGETTPGQRPGRRPRPTPAPGVTMRIAPELPTYACLDTGEGTDVVFEGTLEEPQTFRDPERLRLNVGKRSVEVRVNGEPVEIPESPEPFGLDATSDGAEEIVDARPCT